MRKTFAGILAGGLLVALALAAPTLAQAQQVTVGCVDMARISAEYKGVQQLKDQLTTLQAELEGKLQERTKVAMLTDDDYNKYRDARQAAPTEANKKLIADLEAKAQQRESRLREVAAIQTRTPEQEAEYKELSGVYSQRATEIQKINGDNQKTLEAKQDELVKAFTESLATAAKSVAADKKLTLVVAKELVLTGGVDVTNDVLAKLNATGK